MFSPVLHSLLVKTHLDDLDREASTLSMRASARRQSRFAEDAISDESAAVHDNRSTYRFLRHYAEMVAVMFAGMFALMAPTGLVLSAFGTSWSGLSPAMNTFAMALTMTLPMVAWMRYRGHAWRPNVEMAASMLIPTFAVMGVLWTGIAKGGLTVPEHAGMLTCMLIAMLLRRGEYACAAHRRGHTRPAIAA
jgi:hypothetical protein